MTKIVGNSDQQSSNFYVFLNHLEISQLTLSEPIFAGLSFRLKVEFSVRNNRLYNMDVKVSLRKLAHAINRFFFILKIENFQLFFFTYFCSKHRLWVLLRTALPSRF